MRKIHIKRKSLLATVFFLLATIIPSATLVYAGSNKDPIGNNGTVKIDGTDIDQAKDNDPHVGCTFSVDWWNFDANAGTITATVTFELQSPTTEPDNTMAVTGNLLPQFIGNGTNTVADQTEQYTLAFTGPPQQNQGYHVKLTVNTPYSSGNDEKSKVFWVEDCNQPATLATPQASTPTCNLQTETITPAAITGGTWSPVGTTQLAPGQSVTYTATADDGYAFADGAQTSWTFTNSFDNSGCGQTQGNTTITVTPAEPDTSTPSCQVQSETITPITATGIIWSPSVATVLNSGNPTVTYTATPDTGYAFPNGATTSWPFTYSFNSSDCGSVLGDNVTVITPGDPDPSFIDATCSTAGSYTVVAQDGVVYEDANGNVIEAGTYTATNGTTVTITASPADETIEFSNDTQTVWTHTFNPPSCGQVLGASTVRGSTTGVSGDPQVLGASTTLTDSGVSPIFTTAIASFIIVISTLVHGKHRSVRRKQIEVRFL